MKPTAAQQIRRECQLLGCPERTDEMLSRAKTIFDVRAIVKGKEANANTETGNNTNALTLLKQAFRNSNNQSKGKQ